MATKQIKTYSLAEMKDKYIGKVGTVDRDEYEYELRMDVLGKMIKAARQERNLTQEELVIMVDTNIKANPALSIFSENFIKRLRDLTINIYKKYTNMPAETVVEDLIKNYNTWDNYSLSVMLLCLIGYISHDGFTENQLIVEFSQLLLLNIHPNASKRLSFDDTKKRYNKLFSLDVSVIGYENVLHNFDKKIFSDRILKESMQQEKVTLGVLNKFKNKLKLF